MIWIVHTTMHLIDYIWKNNTIIKAVEKKFIEYYKEFLATIEKN